MENKIPSKIMKSVSQNIKWSARNQNSNEKKKGSLKVSNQDIY